MTPSCAPPLAGNSKPRREGCALPRCAPSTPRSRIVEDTAPTVILLEKTSATPESEGSVAKMPRLNSVVSALAVHAPVVVIGRADQETELASLVAAGAADFVERAGGCLPVALELVERRLRQAQHLTGNAHDFAALKTGANGEAFGEN